MSSLFAISWEPELRGMLIVIIAVVTFCGSVYLILATNLGARLGFLVALTGLAGWMALMGIIWMIYGIGLKGPEPSWEAIPGRTVLQDTDALYRAGVFEQRVEVPEDALVPGARPSSSPPTSRTRAGRRWRSRTQGSARRRPRRPSSSRRPTPSPPASSGR